MSEIEEEIRRRVLAERAAQSRIYIERKPPPKQGRLHQWQSSGGLLGAIATLLLILAKFAAPVVAVLAKFKGALAILKLASFAKFFITGGSMLVTIIAEAFVFGWAFAFGITGLIFFHECGHAFAARSRGIGWSFMLFIPFMGAMVACKRYGKSLEEDAFIGIMGPVFGAIGGVFCVLMYLSSGWLFWLVLARFNFFMNLFNLLPTPPLDGGWIAPLFSPKLLALGVVLLFVVGITNPMIWVLVLMSLPRIIAGWKADPRTQPYYRVSTTARVKYGIAYLGLAAFLALSNLWLTDWIHSLASPFTPVV